MRLIRACRNSWDGMTHALRTEAAVRLEAMVLVVAIPVAPMIAGSRSQYLLLFGSLLFVMAIEFLNTAIEKLADRVQPDLDPAIKIVKDLGSAAVTVSLVMAAAVWTDIALIAAGYP